MVAHCERPNPQGNSTGRGLPPAHRMGGADDGYNHSTNSARHLLRRVSTSDIWGRQRIVARGHFSISIGHQVHPAPSPKATQDSARVSEPSALQRGRRVAGKCVACEQCTHSRERTAIGRHEGRHGASPPPQRQSDAVDELTFEVRFEQITDRSGPDGLFAFAFLRKGRDENDGDEYGQTTNQSGTPKR
jgi:hypothetical protein